MNNLRRRLAKLEASLDASSEAAERLRREISLEYRRAIWGIPSVTEYFRRLAMGNDAEECDSEREADAAGTDLTEAPVIKLPEGVG